MQQPLLTIQAELVGRLRVGLVAASPVHVGPAAETLLEEIEALAGELGTRFSGRAPAEIPELRPARELYKTFGIDPTKHRPSSEALLRRLLRRKPFPRILNAVDLCNRLALEFLLPLGLYDIGKIHGPVLLRPGARGESYPGIRKNDVHVEGRPVLADDEGPFGNPTSDSARTSVDPSTRSLWLVVFAPASIPAETMEQHVKTARESIERHLLEPGGGCAGSVREA